MTGLQSNALLIGVFAYIANMFKGWFFSIIDYVMRRFTSYVESDTMFWGVYRVAYTTMMTYTKSLGDTVIKNSKEMSGRDKESADSNTDISQDIATGKYIVRLDWLTYSVIVVSRESLNDKQFKRISVRIIGVNHIKHADNLTKMISDATAQYYRGRYIYDGKGSWIANIGKKTFDNIFMERKNEVLEDISIWCQDKDFYDMHAITYKMGILLHGEPGTGKSSFITALANMLSYDIIYLQASDLFSSELRLKPRSVIVLEDVDCISSGLRRSASDLPDNGDKHFLVQNKRNNKQEISNSLDEMMGSHSFLNSLMQLMDGIKSPSEVIFVLTTNHKDKLDPALFRPGRITLDIEMGNISRPTAMDMVRKFGVDESILIDEEFPINPAYLQNKILLDIEKRKYKKNSYKAS